MTLWVPNQIVVGNNIDPIAVQWGPGAQFGDTFVPIISSSLVDHSCQVEGQFGNGTNVQIHGSNDATTNSNGHYHPLTDPYSNTINIGSPQIRQTTEVTSWIRPAIVAGDGLESLTITVAFRRSVR